MKARFQVNTDIARLAAWDDHRGSEPFTSEDFKRWSDALNEEAAAGHVFLLNTGADGGGPLDVYVDESIPDAVRADLTPIEGEFLLSLPSGGLVVDGAEYYRPSEKGKHSLQPPFKVLPGDYAVRCYELRDPEATPKSEAHLERMVGKADIEYYDRMNKRGCLGGLATLLLLPILWYVWGFMVALPVTIVVFLGYFHVKQWFLKRNARYWRLQEVIPAYRHEHEEPQFVLELRPVTSREGLRGGMATV